MAKTQKYSEDRLLEAVIKFAEIEKRKIKATELAKWCRGNMEGLEEVRDYHFTRPIKEKDINLDYSRHSRESGRKPHSCYVLTEYCFSPVK